MAEADQTAAVAVLASQMGELKHAVEGTMRDHGVRISKLEEQEIRRQEREQTEARIRSEVEQQHQHEKEEIQQQHEQHLGRTQLSISKLGLWVAALTALFLAVGTIVGILQIAGVKF